MAYFFLDDSKHHKFGFSLAALVICETDPTIEIRDIFKNLGFDPVEFEYKSSSMMKGDEKLQLLRSALRNYIVRNCKIAVCITNEDKKIGPSGLQLLENALNHPWLERREHEVYFDEGLFSSPDAAHKIAESFLGLRDCNINFEQDSKKTLGIQLADLVAHTCSIMLLEAMGCIDKKVVLNMPKDDLYHGMEVELGWEMWARIRYAFLCQNKPNPKDDFELAFVDVYPWGLFIDEDVNETISNAAMEQFSENYLGCIH